MRLKLELEIERHPKVWVAREKYFNVTLSAISYKKLLTTLVDQLSDKIKEEIRKRAIWEED